MTYVTTPDVIMLVPVVIDFKFPVINTHDRLSGGAYIYLGLRFKDI